ncbi:MAG: glycosyltransferase family 39 protein [Bacteroidales bacterium]|nr:glycosyltransferase family 39 protein [Bacteroidales bacterium]
MKTSPNYRNYLWLLIGISTLVRGLLAGFLELGNDEVYYRLYALYPDWSHFDHPPMVGWVIQLFSLNLLFDSEFFLRLASVVFGAINLWLVFDLGRILRNERAGFYAALLFTASIYGFVITGIFILPDTPQNFFWLLSLRLMLRTLPFCPHQPVSGIRMLNLGFVLGLGILSKYTTVFLWLGALLYIGIYNREWFRSKWLYLSIFISLLFTLPIIYWNLQNDFVSFRFQGERVNLLDSSLSPNYFLTEIAGEFFYNNPVNFVLIVLAVIAGFRGKLKIGKAHNRIILLATLPLIFTFHIFSLFRSTLPHWSAPAYTSLVILAAAWLDQQKVAQRFRVSAVLYGTLFLLFIILLLGILQVRLSLFQVDYSTAYHNLGKNDPSLDLTGFRQAGIEFAKIVERDRDNGSMPENAFLTGDNWFPLANYDYYAASPLGMKVYGLGPLERIHKYAWINRINGPLTQGMDAYYLTDSRDYRSPYGSLDGYFEKVEAADTIHIFAGKKEVKRAFVFRLRGLKKLPAMR